MLLATQPLLSQAAQPSLPRAASPQPVYVLPYKGAIGPATVRLIEKGLKEAQQGGGQLLIIELDTPGGLDASTREITQLLIGAPLPIAVYVAPGGARAASAGTYILYAAHIAAMAQATSIGAATPVLMGEPSSAPVPLPGRLGEKRQKKEADGEAQAGDFQSDEADAGQEAAPGFFAPRSALERKAENDAVAHIRGLAELRGRNAEWAEAAVRQAVAISAKEALAQGVIEHVAVSREQLLEALDGAEISLQQQTVTLHTVGAPQVVVEPGLQIALLTQLASPALASILLGLGVPLILLEFYVGAGGIAAALGLVLCVIGAYGLNLLPLEYSGIALMLTGVLFILADMLLGVTGFLLIAGLGMAVIGGVLFSRTDGDYWALSSPSLWWLLLMAVVLCGLLLWIIRAHRRPAVSGLDQVQGQEVEVLESFEAEGWVLFQSERWKGVIAGKVDKGERLRIVEVKGLKLTLQKMSEAEQRES